MRFNPRHFSCKVDNAEFLVCVLLEGILVFGGPKNPAEHTKYFGQGAGTLYRLTPDNYAVVSEDYINEKRREAFTYCGHPVPIVIAASIAAGVMPVLSVADVLERAPHLAERLGLEDA